MSGSVHALLRPYQERIAELEAALASQKFLTESARERWSECQYRLASIESELIEITGLEQGIASNIEFIRQGLLMKGLAR